MKHERDVLTITEHESLPLQDCFRQGPGEPQQNHRQPNSQRKGKVLFTLPAAFRLRFHSASYFQVCILLNQQANHDLPLVLTHSHPFKPVTEVRPESSNALFHFLFFFPFIFISWRLIALQYRNGFCHTLT